MKKPVKYSLTALSFLAVIATGYFRDFVFRHINYRLSQLYYSKQGYDLPASLGFFNRFDYAQLYYIKFILTLLFILLFLFLSVLCIKLIFSNNRFVRYTIISFSAVFLLSAFFFAYGYLFNDYERGYRFSRIIAGFIQSPLLLMLLIPAFQLYKKQSPAS